TSTVKVSKSLASGFCVTVTIPVALGKRALILDGTRGNCTIKVGATDASTLTVGAIFPCSPNAGTRRVGAFFGKPPPLVVVVGVLFVVGCEGPSHATTSRLNKRIPIKRRPTRLGLRLF